LRFFLIIRLPNFNYDKSREHVESERFILFYFILFYFILFYFILFYFILFAHYPRVSSMRFTYTLTLLVMLSYIMLRPKLNEFKHRPLLKYKQSFVDLVRLRNFKQCSAGSLSLSSLIDTSGEGIPCQIGSSQTSRCISRAKSFQSL
jgi:hypothetical protein